MRLGRRILTSTGCRVGMLALGALAVACGGGLDFPPWSFEVPEGTPVLEYPAVEPGKRAGNVIELVEDLAIGNETDPDYIFYQPRDIDVTSDGTMYVLDAGNHRVQVFDAEGQFVRTIGRGEGEGPGEFATPTALAVVGDRIVIRADRSRWTIYDLEGSHLGDVSVDDNLSVSGLTATPEGNLLGSFYELRQPTPDNPEPSGTRFVATFSIEGQVLERHAELPLNVMFAMPGQPRPAPVGRPSPDFAAAEADHIYITYDDQYQVLALDRAGAGRWALRVAQPPEPLPEQMIEETMERQRERNPEAARGDYIWPDVLPVLSTIKVDNHGHLYVYPYIRTTDAQKLVPVDVYSEDGERLFAGMIERRSTSWRIGRGDFVYAVGTDVETGEYRVKRYRLSEPF